MQPRSRADQLADTLRKSIQDGILPIGSKLPSEQTIATDHQVSRTVVREAVARLKSGGLLETRKGAPTRVRAAGGPSDAGLSMPRSIDGLLGFLEVRRSIEAEMAALAAERRTGPQCQEIEAALRAIDRSTSEGGSGVQEDLDFHLAIGRATSNAYWNQFVRLFAEPIRLAIGITRANEARRRDFASAVAQKHRRIYDAVLRRDRSEAHRAVYRHISNAADRVMHADHDFWQQEGGNLAAIWAARALLNPIDCCESDIDGPETA